MMNLNQTKLVGLTMELDLKARENKKLCDKLEQLKQSDINPNDEKLLELKQLFQKNYDEIVEINRQIKELKEAGELIEKQKLEKYNTENIFNKRDNGKIKQEEKMDISVVETKNNVFARLIEKIKQIFSKNNK